jgi:hypothetical protein
VAGEDDFYAQLDGAAWARAVVVDAYNQMQKEVAQAVQAGRRDEALARLRQFKDETAAMNARVQSAPVAAQLDSTDRLAADVAAAFEGADQAQRQNELGKAASAQAIESRRVGSKK